MPFASGAPPELEPPKPSPADVKRIKEADLRQATN